MNVKPSRPSDNSEKETTMAAELETLEPVLMKKLQISNPTETKDCVKISTTDGKGNIK